MKYTLIYSRHYVHDYEEYPSVLEALKHAAWNDESGEAYNLSIRDENGLEFWSHENGKDKRMLWELYDLFWKGGYWDEEKQCQVNRAKYYNILP